MILFGEALNGLKRLINHTRVDIKQDEHSITLSQNSYLDSVKGIPLVPARAARKYDELNKTETDKLRSLVGQLNWLDTI